MPMKLKEGDWVIWRGIFGGFENVAQVRGTTKTYISIRFPGNNETHAVTRKEVKKISERRGVTLAAAIALGVK